MRGATALLLVTRFRDAALGEIDRRRSIFALPWS